MAELGDFDSFACSNALDASIGQLSISPIRTAKHLMLGFTMCFATLTDFIGTIVR